MEQDGPPRALVVSNDHRFLSLIRTVLAETGLETCTAERWEAVIEHAKRAQPQIILLDLNVTHGSSCVEALRELRANAGTGKVPIVVCPTAGWLVDEYAVDLQQPGIWLWQAPFDPSVLLLTVEATLRETALTPDGHPIHMRQLRRAAADQPPAGKDDVSPKPSNASALSLKTAPASASGKSSRVTSAAGCGGPPTG